MTPSERKAAAMAGVDLTDGQIEQALIAGRGLGERFMCAADIRCARAVIAAALAAQPQPSASALAQHDNAVLERGIQLGMYRERSRAHALAEQARADERAAFEAHIRKDCGDLTTFGSAPHIHYRNGAVNNAWTGWQARAALSATQPNAGTPAGYRLLEDGKTAIPADWVPLRMEWEPGYPEDVACGPVRAMERLKKWLDAYFVMIQQRMTPAAQAPAPAPEALARINAYIARRKAARGIDIERIHGFDPGHERGVELLLSDLEALALQAPASATRRAIVSAAAAIGEAKP